MIIRQVDAPGDWKFGKGISNYAVREEAIQQNIASRIKSWVGDCFFAPGEGVDWKARLDVGQQSALVEEVKTVIGQSFGVIGVTVELVSFIGSIRTIFVNYTAKTIYGQEFQAQIQQTIGG